MTLHEAIIKVLQQAGRSMKPSEIADALNRNKWYAKGDNSSIATSQISARIAKYPELFSKSGSLIIARGEQKTSTKNQVSLTKTSKIKDQNNTRDELSEELKLKILMNEKNFKLAGTIDQKVPDSPGLYCIRISDINILPSPFNTYLKERKHNILYIGIATRSLKKRFLGQELRAEGHGTFFRGVGAVTGYRPPIGSLKDKANKNNYTFSPADKKKIILWINQNLVVNWVTLEGNFGNIETQLITQYLPLLNTDKNPVKLRELAELRRECSNIARG